jgi:hypothetical protein
VESGRGAWSLAPTLSRVAGLPVGMAGACAGGLSSSLEPLLWAVAQVRVRPALVVPSQVTIVTVWATALQHMGCSTELLPAPAGCPAAAPCELPGWRREAGEKVCTRFASGTWFPSGTWFASVFGVGEGGWSPPKTQLRGWTVSEVVLVGGGGVGSQSCGWWSENS